jgi:hypothetical protein
MFSTHYSGEDTILYTVQDPHGAMSEGKADVTVSADGDGIVQVRAVNWSLDIFGPGFEDADGDQIDGGDGDNDTIDVGWATELDPNESNRNAHLIVNGGEGSDTMTWNDLNQPEGPGIYSRVQVDVYNDGTGTLSSERFDIDASTDEDLSVDFDSIETLIGGEGVEFINFGEVTLEQIRSETTELSADAVGNYYKLDGSPSVYFGPMGPTLWDLLDADQGSTGVGPFGLYEIQGGSQSGHIGNTSFENFENIEFYVSNPFP